MGDDPARVGPHLQAITAHGRVPADAEKPTRPLPEAVRGPQRRGGRVATRLGGVGPARVAVQVVRGARPARPDDQA